jgi:dTDP-glucose pyrophosphorylase/predicted transcriptional regulator
MGKHFENIKSIKVMHKNTIQCNTSIKDALKTLNQLGTNLTLFVLSSMNKLEGTLTDGDIRRGLLKGYVLSDIVDVVMNKNFKYISNEDYDKETLKSFREQGITLVPILDKNHSLIKILDLSVINRHIKVDAIIMAGGEGTRLRPLTLNTPKPLLKVGNKPIIEHNIDRLMTFGVNNFFISIKYLGDQIQDYFVDGSEKNINIRYLKEELPLGTIGSLSLVPHFEHEDVLVMNSDLLTNIDFEDFYNYFKNSNADMAVATTSYQVNIPYAVMELEKERVISFKEKPTYTFYSNAGIYLIKKEVVKLIPKNINYNATDLMELIINSGKKIVHYPILGYWLDIGSHSDFEKAQLDVNKIFNI